MQPEVNLQRLSTDKLLDEMAGGENARRARFRANLMAMYPTNSLMWSIEPPSAAGGASAVASSPSLKALGAALERNAAAKALKAAVDGGGGDLYQRALENARRVQATW